VIIDLAKTVRVENEIARRGGLGLKRFGSELVGPCPQCGGRDRFAINVRKQIFLCRGCGVGGDIIALVQHLDGCGFKEAVQMLGGVERKPTILLVKPKVQDHAERTALALRLWDDASPISGTLAEAYLRRRGVELPPGDEVLRFYGRCPFGDGRYSCMLALYRDIITNEARAIQRTALGPNGNKVGRMSLGAVAGAAVKLDADEDVEQGLFVGEGVETMLGARMLGYSPAWALGCSGNLRKMPVLDGIEALTIIADNDKPDRNGRRAGQEAAIACSQRWTAAGREVRRIVPRRAGADLADVVQRGRHVT
jgi:phage/plasmid primase-like uncharacterized protein